MLTSCQAARHTLSSSIIDGEWNITEVNGSAVKAESRPYIGFDIRKNRVYGTPGCNRISGSFDFEDKNGQIKFGAIASTMMACPDMELERNILQALNSAESIKSSGKERLTLCDKNKKPLLKMERRFHKVPFSDIKGKWRIVTVFGENAPADEQAPFVDFDTQNGRLSAFAGCNRLSGAIKSEGDNKLTISNVASTRMACPDMSLEQNVITALGQAGSFGISPNGKLLLLSAGGNAVMELTRMNKD